MRGAPETARGPAARQWVRVVGWLLVGVLCLAALAAASGSAGAASLQSADNTTDETTAATNDTAPPSLVAASKTNATAINVTVADDSDIRTSAIVPSTFTLSAGRVRNVSTRNFTAVDGVNGTYVTLLLPERLNTDNVTVSIASGGNVTDEHGNRLTGGNVTASGMDTSVPAYDAFTVEQLDQRTVEIRLVTNERLDAISVAVTGPTTDELAREDFTESVGRRVIYTAEYAFSEEGSHSIVWERATDRYGNTRHMTRMRQFYYEADAPDISLSAPEAATVGEALTFDAGASTDEDGIDGYRWRIDGGTILSGRSIDVAFASAGTHDVVLEVTDSEGNTAVTTRQVQVTTAEGVPSAVRVTRENASAATATVDGTGFVQQVRAERGPLAAGANASLERVTAAFPANDSVMLSIRAHDAAPASFDGPGLARFAIDHAGVPAEDVTLRFALNRSALADADPSDVVLYREGGTWTPLSTTVVSEGDERVVFDAASPGLSRFVVGLTGEEPTATPETETTATATPTETDSPAPASTPSGGTEADTPTAPPATSEEESGPFSALPDSVTGLVPQLPATLPNPLALWPDGIVGTVLAGVFGFVAVVYAILKALAIYLGY